LSKYLSIAGTVGLPGSQILDDFTNSLTILGRPTIIRRYTVL